MVNPVTYTQYMQLYYDATDPQHGRGQIVITAGDDKPQQKEDLHRTLLICKLLVAERDDLRVMLDYHLAHGGTIQDSMSTLLSAVIQVDAI